MIDAETLELFLVNDEDIKISEKLAEGFFKIHVQVPDSQHFAGERAEMLVTMKVNPDFVIFYSRVTEDHLGFALAACANSNMVGLIALGDGFMLRSALFAKLCDPVAVNNAARAHALAAMEYQALAGAS